MTWTSDYGAQRACPKGLVASGPKGLEPIYYSIQFTTEEGTTKLRISAVQQQQVATATAQLRRLAACLSRCRHWFNPRKVHVQFVVDEVAL